MVDDADFEMINKFNWYLKSPKANFNYAARTYLSDGKRKLVFMHRMILNVTDRSLDIDHKDGNGLNNQRDNIRIATRSENNRNRKAKYNSTSQYVGVSKAKDGRWAAQIKPEGKNPIGLGWYINEIDAALAYNKAAIKIHGEFAKLNKI